MTLEQKTELTLIMDLIDQLQVKLDETEVFFCDDKEDLQLDVITLRHHFDAKVSCIALRWSN